MRREKRRTINGNGRMVPSEWFWVYLKGKRTRVTRAKLKRGERLRKKVAVIKH